jgi:glycosyltransferase involved in cell wall biosynthesis
MKVLHVIKSLQKAGAEKICIDICNELFIQKNIEVLLVSMDEKNDFNEIEFKFPYKIVNSKVLPSLTKKSIIDISEFSKIVEEFNPDIIHSHLFWAELLSRQKIYPNIIYITHCHDNIGELEKFSKSTLLQKNKFTKYYERLWILNKYEKCKNNFIVISKDSKKYFEKVLPKKIRNITLMHNAIDTKQFIPPLKLKTKDCQKIKLINIGRFAKYKNQQFLIDVVRIISSKGYDVELHLLGHGPEFFNVQAKAKEYKLENTVLFHGVVNNVNHHLWDSSLYVHSAYYEPFGLVFLEAMAAGLPIVTLNGKGNIDIIVENKNAILINNSDAELFAQSIIELWQDQEIYLKMSNYAKEFAKNYDISKYTQKLVKYYEQLIDERRIQKN